MHDVIFRQIAWGKGLETNANIEMESGKSTSYLPKRRKRQPVSSTSSTISEALAIPKSKETRSPCSYSLQINNVIKSKLSYREYKCII